jgi:hypothetical protein
MLGAAASDNRNPLDSPNLSEMAKVTETATGFDSAGLPESASKSEKLGVSLGRKRAELANSVDFRWNLENCRRPEASIS